MNYIARQITSAIMMAGRAVMMNQWWSIQYVAPPRAAALLAQHTPPTGKILDCGCGTGLVGVELVSLGMNNIDGVDISANMLQKAREKNMYSNLSVADITTGFNFPDNTYDAAVSVGTFTVGHVGPDSMPEVIRVTRPNGVIVFTVNEMVFEKDGYPQKMREWEQKNITKTEDCFKDSYILETNNEGYFIVLRVL